MKTYFQPPKTNFPPCVIGTVTDWITWVDCTSATSIVPCFAVELRIDALPAKISANDIQSRQCRKPVLLTIRHHDEGGQRVMEESARIALMSELMSMATAIDWEVRHLSGAEVLLDQARNAGVKIIASWHDFDKTPSLAELQAQEDYARSKGVDMVKFAFRLNSLEDMMVGAQLIREAKGPIAVMGMGILGPTSRMLYSQLGSALIYGYLGDNPAAPGQWPTKLCGEVLDNLKPLS